MLDKADLHGRIWPDTYVVDANLNVLIAEIRRALEDSPRRREVHPHGSCGWLCILRRGRGADGSPVLPENAARSVLAGLERPRDRVGGRGQHGRPRSGVQHLAGCVWRVAPSCARQNRPRRRRGPAFRTLAARTARSFANAPITGEVRLTDGAVIQIGSVELTLRIWSEGKSTETERIPRGRKNRGER